jgi:acetyl-CoA hydrolase
VVTDYGIAALAGKTVQDRMKAMINIAHPEFREELTRKAFEIYHVRI